MIGVYQASPIKRRRATNDEMAVRAEFLVSYAEEFAPVTVRQLFYAATVAGLVGIDKTEQGYAKVQSQVLALRREGRLSYAHIADATRYMRKPTAYDGWQEALRETAHFYRKSLWPGRDVAVEIWLEKGALAGVLEPVTSEYDVPLMPTGGYTSETFAHGAVDALRGTGRKLIIYSLYDFDRSGKDAEASLQENVTRFGREYDVPVEFHSLGLSFDQVHDFGLPTRPAKSRTVADQRWPYPYAAELDAIPPDILRVMVRRAIEENISTSQLEALRSTEEWERNTLLQILNMVGPQ